MRSRLNLLLSAWEKSQVIPVTPPPDPEPKPAPRPAAVVVRPRVREPYHKETVAGGEVRWQPINRDTAKILSKAPWWAQPVQTPSFAPPAPTPPPPPPKPPKQKKKAMSEQAHKQTNDFQDSSGYTMPSGLKVQVVNGEPMMRLADLQAVVCAQIEKLHTETRGPVRTAQEARTIINELLVGIGGDMERFKADTRRYIEDVRSVRFSMVTEVSHMVGPLKEVRQFFLGSDYKEELKRLQDFVDLCERLQKLHSTGFLDKVADTMLRLA